MTQSLEVDVWTDYLCPWAYLGRHHTNWLRTQGTNPAIRAFELHPELPPTGRAIRPGGGFHRLLVELTGTAAELGLEMRVPDRTPNTRRALELLELVRRHEPTRTADYDDAVARAVWIDGSAIDDPAVLDAIVAGIGLDVASFQARLDLGEGAVALAEAREHAIDAGVAGTPAWCIAGLTVTGLHSDDQFHRWVDRILRRRAAG